MKEVPVWEKFTLTIQEAAGYFNLGEKKIRQLVRENEESGFVLQNGNKILIKREKFEEYINAVNSV